MVDMHADGWLNLRKNKRLLTLATAAIAFTCGTANVMATGTGPYFDWQIPDTNVPANSNYTPAPFLSDSNASTVEAYLQSQSGQGGILAVRVVGTLSSGTIQTVFNNPSYPVQYVFADLESNPVGQVQGLISQLNGTASQNAYVGNFAISTVATDPTLPAGYPGYTLPSYRSAGVTMANPGLYPGAPSFRDPAQGSKTVTGGSFPNLRTALFALPIERLSFTAQNVAPGTPLVPYVDRFNNFGNSALINGTTNGQQSFTPGIASGALSATQTTNQMLSRDDFQAMMLHYFMRGASGYHLLQSGVVGYTDSERESDAYNGFNYLKLNGLYGGTGPATPVNLGSTVDVLSGGTTGIQSVEDAGVMWSGVTASNATQMSVLVSNMTDTSKTISLGYSIAGALLPSQEALNAPADAHMLYEFTNVSGTWNLQQSLSVFNDATNGMNLQNGVGVPEPSAVSILFIASLGLLGRARRKTTGADELSAI